MYNIFVKILPHYESHEVDSSNGLRQTESRVQRNVAKFCAFVSLSFSETGQAIRYIGPRVRTSRRKPLRLDETEAPNRGVA
jgi:hypothetical protein